jgi:hypothetical protein
MSLKRWLEDGNDCSKCSACLDTSCETQDGTEYDAECLARKEFAEPCRMPLFLRWVLGRRGRYLKNHEFDGYCEYVEQADAANDCVTESLHKILKGYVIAWKDAAGNLHEANTEMIILHHAYEIRDAYEKFLKKNIRPLSEQVWQRAKRQALRPFRFLKSFICK